MYSFNLKEALVSHIVATFVYTIPVIVKSAFFGIACL